MNHFSKIRQNLGDFDAVLLTCAENRLYASGFASHGTDGMAMVTRQATYYFTDFRYAEAAEQQVEEAAIAICTRETPYSDLVADVVAREHIQVLGLDQAYMTVRDYNALAKKLPCDLGDCSPMLSTLRQVKSPWEVEQIVTAQRIAEKALEELKNDMKVGASEHFLAARLEYLMKMFGGEKPSFDTIAITGTKTSMPHGVPGHSTIAAGDFVTLDFGTVYNGYCSDMTRTFALGHATDEMVQVYETVLAAQLAGIATAKAGVTGRAVHRAAAQVIEDAGYGHYFGHGFGHGIGVEIHEAPNASPANDQPLPAGAIISAEPGIYLPNRFGIRIEDMLHITEHGNENLTKAPKKLEIL